MAVGMAIAERHLNAAYGDDLVDHRTWVVAGDGCLMEGLNHEAVGLAGHLKLGRLNVLWDDNRITIDGPTDLSTSEDIAARYAAAHWHVCECDGHDPASIRATLDETLADPRPSLIACRTVIGFGAPNKQGTAATHGAPLGEDEIAAAREVLGWDHPAFAIPDDVLADWRATGGRGASAREKWETRLAGSDQREAFRQRMAGSVPDGFDLSDHIATLVADPPKLATRKASELALEVINAQLPATIGGSADLTGSNNTKAGGIAPLTADDYSGRYLYYGIREFGMAAAMNGMALHGGVIPYGGTFLVFTDYARGAIRLSALQQARVIYVMTHDSIGLGEDGPTHQPIEHLQSLRAMPNLLVLRPADAVETAEAWEIALRREDGPSVLALSRQGLPPVRTEATEGNRSERGAYRLKAGRGGAARGDRGDRVRGPPRARMRGAARGAGRGRRRRLDALHRTVRRTAREVPARDARPRGAACQHRGRNDVRLGTLYGHRGAAHRDRPLRRLRPRARSVRALRLYGRRDRSADHRETGKRQGIWLTWRPR